jgi:hypothetical protein
VVHFQSPDYPASWAEALACNLQLRVRPGVCQLRVDFLDLIMPGPGANGECTNINNFKIMAPGASLGLIGAGTDSLCGENTGNHLYIPVTKGDSVQMLATLSGIGAVPLATDIGKLSCSQAGDPTTWPATSRDKSPPPPIQSHPAEAQWVVGPSNDR